jgi:hypothetical protein
MRRVIDAANQALLRRHAASADGRSGFWPAAFLADIPIIAFLIDAANSSPHHDLWPLNGVIRRVVRQMWPHTTAVALGTGG